jgi:hypothetical protein
MVRSWESFGGFTVSFPFGSHKEERDDSQAKTKGYRQMVKDMIAWLKDANKEAQEYATRGLNELTGESFERPDEWQQWYQHRSSELDWSDEKHKFVTEQKDPDGHKGPNGR